jgi:hypothetical protein
MPAIRICKSCGQKNRVGAKHLADTGRCGACKVPLPPIDEPLEANDELFDEVIQGTRVPVLVDFWAEWCGRAGPPPRKLRVRPATWQAMPSSSKSTPTSSSDWRLDSTFVEFQTSLFSLAADWSVSRPESSVTK